MDVETAIANIVLGLIILLVIFSIKSCIDNTTKISEEQENKCIVSVLVKECERINVGKYYREECKDLKDKYYTVHKGNNLVYIEKIEDNIEKVKANALKAQKEFCPGK